MTHRPILPRQLAVLLLLGIPACSPSKSCYYSPDTPNIFVAPDELSDWIDAEENFVGDCKAICEPLALVSSPQPCFTLEVVDHTYPLSAGGSNAAQGLGSSGAGGASSETGGLFRISVQCDYGERQLCSENE